MKNNKLNNLVALASIGASLLVGGATSSQAAVSLGANFIGRNNSAAIMVQTNSAGVIPQANWNNIDTGGTFIGTSDPLLSSDGKFTAVTLDYAAQDSWVSDGPTVTGDEKMMKGILKFKDAANGGPGSITFKNLPAGTYDAYVYCEEDGTGAEGEIAIGSVTNYIKVDNIFSGTYSNYPASAPGAPVSGNYAKWSAVAPAADGSLMLTAVKTSVANNGIGIAGFQLVQVSGGAFPANTNTCSITADPASTKGLVGATAAFSVGTAGPCKIMWKKNGTVIPGATSPVLNYNYTLADDNAAFVAVVYNNVNTNNSAAAILRVYSADKGISLNWIGRGNDQYLAANDPAGVLASLNWNNVATAAPPVVGDASSLSDGAGNATLIDLHYDFPDSWNSDGGTGTPNEKMMKGIMKVNIATPSKDMVIHNLNTNSTYDIYTYHAENGAAATCDMTVTIGSTSFWIEMPASFNDIFTQCTNTTGYQAANYVYFNGVAPAADGTITIQLVRDAAASSDGGGIAGLQIFTASGPEFLTNTVPVAITTQPTDTVGAVGGVPVSFTVGYTGPARFQWQTNGVDVAGATGATYSFAPTLAANGVTYSVRVYNNVNSMMSSTASVIVDSPAPLQLVKNFLKVERWENIGGNVGTQGITDLTNAIAAGPPTVTFYESGANVPQSSPDISNFGVKLSGWVSPTVNGDYDFFIRSDDSSQLFLNSVPAGVGKTNALPDYIDSTSAIAFENNCCAAFLEPGATQTTLAPIHLIAGNLYGLVAIQKEGGGGDYVQVAWRLSTQDPLPTAASLTPIPAEYCYTLASPAGQRATITTQPKPAVVFQNKPANFSVAVQTLPTAGTYSLQWFTNGTAVAGATKTNYKIPTTTLAQNSTQVKVQVSSLAGTLNSDVVSLTVLADTNPPVVLGATAFPGSTRVGVTFDEELDPVTANNPANYKVNGAAVLGVYVRTNVSNELNNEKNLVQLTVASALSADFTVTVNGVKDIYNNAVVNKTAPGSIIKLTSQDIGTPTGAAGGPDPIVTGSVVNWGPGNYDVYSGGSDYYNNADGFHYIWEKKTGSFDVKVRCVSVTPVSQWSAVGLMVRESLSEYSREYHEKVVTRGDETTADSGDVAHGSNDYELNSRPATGDPLLGNSANTGPGGTRGWSGTAVASMGPPNYPDAWVRIAREKKGTSDHLKGYGSNDGETWTLIQDVDLNDANHAGFLGIDGNPAGAWPDPCYIGMATTAHNNGTNANTSLPWAVWGVYRDYGDMPAAGVSPTISVTSDPVTGKITITYTGTLASSDAANGTYAPVSGATSPYMVDPKASGAKVMQFYKAQQ